MVKRQGDLIQPLVVPGFVGQNVSARVGLTEHCSNCYHNHSLWPSNWAERVAQLDGFQSPLGFEAALTIQDMKGDRQDQPRWLALALPIPGPHARELGLASAVGR